MLINDTHISACYVFTIILKTVVMTNGCNKYLVIYQHIQNHVSNKQSF